MLSKTKQTELTAKSDRLSERWRKMGFLPHPRELSTPQGFSLWGNMRTRPIDILIYCSFFYPMAAEYLILMVNEKKLDKKQAALVEAISDQFEQGVPADAVKVYRYMREHYPQIKFTGVSTLIDERDHWNIDASVMDQTVITYLNLYA
jgi:hypothetical protein